MKKRVFIDMDNVLVDFQSGLDMMSEETKQQYAGRLDEIPGLFGKMKPMAGAIEAVHRLQEHFDLLHLLSYGPMGMRFDIIYGLCMKYGFEIN